MNNYEITYKGIKHIIIGYKLVCAMIAWSKLNNIDANEIESFILINNK